MSTTRSLPRDGKQTSDPAHEAGREPPVAPAADRRRKAERPRVGWIATTAIVLMLLMGAAWELWRWLLLLITLD